MTDQLMRHLLHGGAHSGEVEEGYSSEEIGGAFGLTIGAALATGIGSSVALCLTMRNKRNGTSNVVSPKLMAASLGLAAGVIIWIGFVDLFSEGKEFFNIHFSDEKEATTESVWASIGFFFLGILLTTVSSHVAHRYLDHNHGPGEKSPVGDHELVDENPRDVPTGELAPVTESKIAAVGFATAAAMVLHNIPEGMATFVAYLSDPLFGVAVAIAIALHNIPQGISVAMPILYSSKNACKAFWISFSCGFSQVLGALIAYAVVSGSGFNNFTFGVLNCLAAGMMVSVASSELLPSAFSFDKDSNITMPAYFAGMAVIAISIAVFAS